MSFQWVFNNATSISIDRLDTVASTQTRSGVVKAVSRGTPKKLFTVQLPDGPRWADIYTNIEAAETLDKHTTDDIEIEYATHPWYYGNVVPGSNESYTVICVQFPRWTVAGAKDSAQVSWDGPFVFAEV